MTIKLLTGWLSHEAGTVLDLGAGQAELLINRGVAVAYSPPVEHKAVIGPLRRRDRVSRETSARS